MQRILGLDIGGANLKSATSDGEAAALSFPLWKHPEQLADHLRSLILRWPVEGVAITMTGELCDCFANKREGVVHIVAAAQSACAKVPLHVWCTERRFLTPAEAMDQPRSVAAANWHALATFAGSFAPTGPALLIDIGSTTTDIIPMRDGVPCPLGQTDPQRLRHGELVYTGVRRSPLCSILGMGHAAEFFATTEDAYLLLGDLAEEPERHGTADGRPATRAAAHARIARMSCDDADGCSRDDAIVLARAVEAKQVEHLAASVRSVLMRLGESPTLIIQSGSGEFLIPRVLSTAALAHVPILSLSERLGPHRSEAACAYAVAKLCATMGAEEDRS